MGAYFVWVLILLILQYTCSVANALWLTEWNYTALCYIHYLAVQQAMVSVHRPVHSKIVLTCLLAWHTDGCTPQRMGENCQNGLLTWLCALSIVQLHAWAHLRSAYSQISPVYLLSTLYVIDYSSPNFLYCKQQKIGRGHGTREHQQIMYIMTVGQFK